MTPPANQTIAREPYVRWLAIGNSITAHGPRESLQWTGEPRGMAASSVEKDYIHLLQAKMKARDPRHAAELKIAGRMGKLSAGTMEQMNTALDELRDWNADLVTIQLGENDRFAEIGRDEFEKRYRNLVDAMLSGPKRPVIVCTGVWSPPGEGEPVNVARYKSGSEEAIKDEIIEAICREKGLIFAPIAHSATNPSHRGFGATPGVRWHPNDAGMQAYADAIFAALFRG